MLTAFGFQTFAQKIKVNGTNANLGGGSHSAFVVTIYGVKASEVKKEWKSLIKGYAPEKLSVKKEVFADNVKISSISDNTIDVYASAKDGKDNSVIFAVGFDLGGAWLSSNNTAEKMVYDFAVKMTKQGVEAELKNEEKELGKKEKNLVKLKKDNDNLHKAIAKYENEIETAKNNIVQAKKDIETNLKDQETGKKDIESQKKKVQQVGDKLKNVK